MFHKVSPEPMENSSGYVSNTNSMNQTVKYATVGRSRPGGVKRTSSLVVAQPVVPTLYKAPPSRDAPREVRKHYKNDLGRPSSRASHSSAGSGPRRPSSRSSREAGSERIPRNRPGSRRSSHSKIRRPPEVRRPESRASSKALILRRRESARGGSAAPQRPQRDASIRSGRETRPETRGPPRPPAGKPPPRSLFAGWKPKITLRRSKSLQVKPEPPKKREIRFGDEVQPHVIRMQGVETRREGSPAQPARSETTDRPSESPGRRLTQTLTRPAKRPSPPARSQRASSAEAGKRLGPLGESPREESPRVRRYRPREGSLSSPGKTPSELSSSPRAPVWRADDSDASLSDTLTARSRGSTVRSARRGDKYAARAQRARAKPSASPGERRKDSVINFLRRTFSIKPREKPAAAPVKKRERASSSSVSSLERPARHSKLKTARSHEVLTGDGRDEPDGERKTYRSLPRTKHKAPASTALSRRLSSTMGWAGGGRSSQPQRSRSFKEERPEARNNAREDSELPNNERVDLAYPPVPPKATNEATRGRPRPALEEPIQPVILERRALSQPSLFPPADEREPPQEPFQHYANLPFQLSARHRSSPDLTEPTAASPAKRAASQPSLLAAPRRSASAGSSRSSSGGEARDERPRSRGKKPAAGHRKGILKRHRSSERRLEEGGVKNVNVTRDTTLTRKPGRQRQHGVLSDIANNIKNVFRHRKSSERQPGEGQASPGSNVSERFVNVTNTHEEKESGWLAEEVTQLGDASNEEVTRAIRDGVDAREVLRSGSSRRDQVADPRSQRRLLDRHGRTWRTVDTDDLHETRRHDRNGELLTESAHTHQREEFSNVQVPDEGPDGVLHDQVRSSGHNRRHTKDVDMLEHFSVPKGGRLADGIKLGDGIRYVQENVEGDHYGDEDLAGASERMRDLQRLGFRPQTNMPIEYPQEEKSRRKHTSSWLSNHFGSESGHSRSSEDEGRPRSARKEGERRRETSTYERQTSSGTTQRAGAPPESWQRSEKYTREVRETPERTYIKETRESPRGGFERVQVLPAGSRAVPSSAVSDLTSEVDEDPIFASKFSSGKPRGGVKFSTLQRESRPAPPTSPRANPSPPPSPPPRHKRKNRLKQQSPPQSVPPPPPPPPVERPEPARSFEFHRETRDVTPVRVETSQEDGRLVREYHFRSSESPRGETPVRPAYREPESPPHRPARRGSSSARDSPPRPGYHLFGQRDRSRSTDEPDARPARYTSALNTRLGGGRLHQSSDELDRRPDEQFRAHTIDRRLGGSRGLATDPTGPMSQTLPRKPREKREPAVSPLAGSSRFGGSMINVSVRNNVLGNPPAPRKPARSPVRRSSSLYGKERPAPGGQAASVGLKSPDIISQIQRTASVRRDEPPPPPPPATTLFGDEEVHRRNSENAARSSAEREAHSTIISVSVEEDAPPRRSPPAKIPPKVAPKPRPARKENFMRGLMQTAPELYSALHGDERKDSKTPSPKQSPPLTPPPPLHRARSPASPAPIPLDVGALYPKTPPVFKRIERLRADEEVVTKEGRSRSTTPAEDVHNFRLGTMSPTGERNDIIKVQR